MDKWYKNGLCFSCTQCGMCCSGVPGYVWLTHEDVDNISTYLNISKEEFIKKYTRSVKGRLSLIELKPNYDCVFLKDHKCSLYSSRPKQCKTFPFWEENLSSKQAWENAKEHCPGIESESARRYSQEEIEAIQDTSKE